MYKRQAVALSLSFKIRFWNIGGEGQFIVGAITAATIAFTCGGSLGTGLTIVPVSYTHLDVYKRQIQGWDVTM